MARIVEWAGSGRRDRRACRHLDRRAHDPRGQASSGRGRAVAGVPPARRRRGRLPQLRRLRPAQRPTLCARGASSGRTAAPFTTRTSGSIRPEPRANWTRPTPRPATKGLILRVRRLSGWPLPRLDAGTDCAGAVDEESPGRCKRLGSRRAVAPAADRPRRRRRADDWDLLHRSAAGETTGDAAAGPSRTLAIPAGARDHRVEDAFVLPVDADAARRAAARALSRARGQTHGRRCRTDRGGRCCASPTGTRAGRSATSIALRCTSPPAPASSPPTSSTTRRPIPATPSSRRHSPSGVGGRATRWATSGSRCVAATEADRARLQREARQRMLSEDAIGCELLLRREPDHVPLRNDAALIYMALGRPAEALRHFAAVTTAPARFRGRPGSTRASRSKHWDAWPRREARYKEALRRQPRYSAALNNLGALSMRAGDLESAREMLEAAVKADPAQRRSAREPRPAPRRPPASRIARSAR